MKKLRLSTAIIFLMIIQTQAQWFFGGTKGNGVMVNKTRNVSNYDELLVTGSFNVTLVHGKEGKINIKMEENLVEYLVTEVKGNKLIIKWKKNSSISTRKGVHITVPFKDIDKVSLTGSGDIIGDDVIKASHFETFLSGSGDIILNVAAQSITSKVTGSGNIELLGSTTRLDVIVTGSGGFKSYKLPATKVVAKVTGSGDVMVYASKNLTARVTGSGDITYKGNPGIQDIKISGSGDIEPYR